VTDRSTISRASEGEPVPARPHASALDTAIVALRRGRLILLTGDRAGIFLVLSAELVEDDDLQRLREISSRPLQVVLTRRRAVALGLAPRDALSGAVSIAIDRDLSAAVIRNLADPAASLGVEPPGLGPEPSVAEAGELAAVALARLAALLPAVLVLPLAPAEAALARRRTDFAAVDTEAPPDAGISTRNLRCSTCGSAKTCA
jgi:hypothetical protein